MIRSQQQRKMSRRAMVLAGAATAALAGVTSPSLAELTHRYSFSENGGTVVNDSVGTAHGTFVISTAGPNANIGGGRLSFGNTGTSNNINVGNYVDLPNDIAKHSSFTISGWATWGGGGDWQRFFDFGTNQAGEVQPGAPDATTPYNGTSYFFVTPRTGNDPGNERRLTFNGEIRVDPASVLLNAHATPTTGFPFPTTGEHMFALTRDAATDTVSLYLDGELRDQKLGNSLDPTTISQVNMWLGRSNWHGDVFYNGTMNEFRIYDDARTAAQIATDFSFGPNNLGAAGTNVWGTAGSGNFALPANWSQNHVPTPTEQAILNNGAVVTVNSDVGANNTTTINNGTITMAAGGALTALIDLAPGNGPGSATLNLNGGTLTSARILVDTGAAGGTGNKAINFNGGTLVLTDSFTLVGTNLTTPVSAAGANISVTGAGTVVNWTPALTPASPATVLTKLGSGTLAINGYAGTLAVRAGTLSSSGNVGTAGVPIQLGDAAVTDGGIAGLIMSGTNATTITGPITVGTAAGPGTYTLGASGNNAVSVPGAISLIQNLVITNAAASGTDSLTLGGGITAGSAGAKTLTFNNAGLVDVTAGINNGGAGGTIELVKNNTGIVVLRTSNNYSGPTTINGGGVLFALPGSIGGSGRSVTVNADGVAAAGPGFLPIISTLNNNFFNRINQASSGVLALTSNSSENINFSPTGHDLPAAFLGAASNVAYTGTLTPGGGAYRLGGGTGVLTIAANNALTGANGLIVGNTGGGIVEITGNNSLTGPVTVQRQTVLSIPSLASIGTPTGLTINNATFRTTGATPETLAVPVTLAGPATFDLASGLTLSGAVTSTAPAGANAGPLTKTGPGTLTLTGPVTLNQNSFWMKQGTVVVDTGGSVNSTFFNSIGQNGNDSATLVVQGTGQYVNSHDLNVSDVGNSRGVLLIRDTAQVSGTTLYVGKFNASQGVVVQTGGTMGKAGTGGGEWRIGGGGGTGDAAAVGTYDLRGGTFSTPNNFQVGAFGNGNMVVSGGTANITDGYAAVGRFPGGYGALTVTGTGTFTNSAPASLLNIIGEQGVGIVNVSNGGRFVTTNAPLILGLAGVGTGVVNIGTGGTVVVQRVTAGPGSAALNFHGGTLQALTDDSIVQGPVTYVWPEGGIFDTNGRNVFMPQPLTAPPADGVSVIPLASGGSGYVGTPLVKITGGNGVGASAVAIVDNGVVTGIQVTNPGVGYTDAVTVAILGGGGTGAAAGTATIAPNLSGGITKVGEGQLHLTNANTYTGDTTVNAGTLVLDLPGTLPSGPGTGNLVVNGGATTAGTVDLAGFDHTINALAGGAGAVPGRVVNSSSTPVVLTLGASGTNAAFAGQINEVEFGGRISLTKTGAGTQTLAGVNGYTGPTLVNGGTLRVAGSIAGSEGVDVVDAAATFEAAGTQTVRQLTIFSGQAKVTGPATGTARTVLTVGNGTIDGPLQLGGGKLDVTNQALVYDFTPATPAATAVADIRGHIISGFAGGAWSGNGITSSSAAANPAAGVGYALATEVLGGTGTFLTKTGVDDTSVVARYTLLGDATLDGIVDFNDLVRLAQNYNTAVSASTQSWWFSGDFTYDGTTDFSDLVKLAQNYNTALPSDAVPGAPAGFEADLAAAFASVPEPGGLAAIAAGGLLALARRRRRSLH